MRDIRDIQNIYFIGIGGIGMSALARYFKFHGMSVSGYDKTETILTKELVAEGIPVHYNEDLSQAPKEADVVVYTPAVPKEHAELQFYRANNYAVLKRSEVLGLITKSAFNICVAGTHGKTTVSTMIAHILRHSEFGCNAFLGGISVNYNSNFWSNSRNVCVVEADEYDRSFLKLNPDVAVITAMDPDHLDIYGTAEEVENAFVEFSTRIKPGGLLVHKHGLSKASSLKGDLLIKYSLEKSEADAYASNIQMDHGSYRFDVRVRNWKLEGVILNMGGLHNIENVVAAIAVAHHLGIPDDRIRNAVEAFRGVKRRFEYIVKNERLVYVDDYAHHPEELRALINGARGLFPGIYCTIIFQPHLFTRTRDFADGFAEVLKMADEVLLLPIYPARELPIEGVNSEMIVERMQNNKAMVLEKPAVLDRISRKLEHYTGPLLLITAGAGDIDGLVDPLREIITEKQSSTFNMN